jgi:hypothetical protein
MFRSITGPENGNADKLLKKWQLHRICFSHSLGRWTTRSRRTCPTPLKTPPLSRLLLPQKGFPYRQHSSRWIRVDLVFSHGPLGTYVPPVRSLRELITEYRLSRGTRDGSVRLREVQLQLLNKLAHKPVTLFGVGGQATEHDVVRRVALLVVDAV